MVFTRYIDDASIVQSPKSEELFRDHLIHDAKNGDVFPAIRRNSIDFYYFGSRLFEYRQRFKTHRKFVLLANKKDYLSEEEFPTKVHPASFNRSYKDIKDACRAYAGVEAEGISHIYSRFSYFRTKVPVVVLDIEISFEALNNEGTQDRIDLLLYNLRTRTLMFVEAKHFSNKELWSRQGKPPRVTRQLTRYSHQIQTRRDEIVASYSKYVQNVNGLFDLHLPEPQACFCDCGLYILGFDRDQLKGRFKELLLDDGSLKGVRFYSRGDPKDISAKTLWDKLEKCDK